MELTIEEIKSIQKSLQKIVLEIASISFVLEGAIEGHYGGELKEQNK